MVCQCRPWLMVGLGWLPILVGVLLSLSIIVPYVIAVALDHVAVGFPYISDSGSLPPESCIFGQLLNMAAGLGFAVVYVRYKQVALFGEEYYSQKMLKINRISLGFGALACFGMMVVANFQVGNVPVVHFIGAFILFVPGAIYGYMHSWLSYKMHPEHTSLPVCHIRFVLAVIITIFFVLCTIFSLVSMELVGRSGVIYHWSSKDGGYPEHIVATTSEWIVAIAFLLFFFTFIREFQKITICAELRPMAYSALPSQEVLPAPFGSGEAYADHTSERC